MPVIHHVHQELLLLPGDWRDNIGIAQDFGVLMYLLQTFKHRIDPIRVYKYVSWK